MQPFGVLGIGHCGNNFADLAAKFGYPAGAINTAKEDMANLSHVREQLQVPGYSGAGKDRAVGLEAVSKHWELMVDLASRAFSDTNRIFVVFSGGGGTGSGAGPFLLEVLTESMPDKEFNAILVLPDENEDPNAKGNALEAASKLSQLQRLGATILLDNEKAFAKAGKGKPLGEIYTAANNWLISSIEQLYMLSSRISSVSNLDHRDLETLLSTRGVLAFGTSVLNTVKNTQDVTNAVHGSWRTGMLADPEPGRVISAGIITEGSERDAALLDHTLIFADYGRPVRLFRGVYGPPEQPTEAETKAKLWENRLALTVVAAGLKWPQARLGKLETDVQRATEQVMASALEAFNPSVQGFTSLFSKPDPTGLPSGLTSSKSVLERLKKKD